MAKRVTSGLVVGVDPSVEMLRQAAQRNRADVRASRVELRRGEVSELPVADGVFTKTCAIHALYFWPSIAGGLRELHRVLAHDGLLVLAVRMRSERAGVFEPSRYGLTNTQIDEIVATHGDVGFREATNQRCEIGRETIIGIVART